MNEKKYTSKEIKNLYQSYLRVDGVNPFSIYEFIQWMDEGDGILEEYKFTFIIKGDGMEFKEMKVESESQEEAFFLALEKVKNENEGKDILYNDEIV